MRRFVVFYRLKDMSVSLQANEGTESDVKEFYRRVTDKIYELKNTRSNSSSDSLSISCSESKSDSNSFVPEYKKFLEKVLVCKIKTEFMGNSDFIKLLDYLNQFYYIYED